MNTAWQKLTAEQKVQAITNAVPQLGLSDRAIEKDYWVSLVLETIFNLPDAKQYIFRGGTSLSKGYGLIDRFSEDVDLTFDRSLLSGTSSDPVKIRKKSSRYVKTVFFPQLQKNLTDLVNSIELIVISDDGFPLQDPYLAIKYEPLVGLSLLPSNPYLKPEVKIEPGARAISFPAESRNIAPYLSVAGDKPFAVNTISPQVTFLDKVFLLHTLILAFSRTGQLPPARQSRHLYDLYQLYHHPAAQTYIHTALTDSNYYQQLAAHHLQFFKVPHIGDYNLASSNINLHLPEPMHNILMADYQNMSRAMFADPDTIIPFADLVKTAAEIQARVKRL